MKKYYIEAVYNDAESEKLEGINYFQNIEVWRESNFSDIHIDIKVASAHLDNEDKLVADAINKNSITINNDKAIWDLMFESIEDSYIAFHNYAVAYNGSHLNYMEIKLVREEEY